MSVQSDVEMLSIQVMEAYASKNHISGDKAIDIFHRYQIFEKIMIQHEYLHQVSLEEVLEFVEQMILEDFAKSKEIQKIKAEITQDVLNSVSINIENKIRQTLDELFKEFNI